MGGRTRPWAIPRLPRRVTKSSSEPTTAHMQTGGLQRRQHTSTHNIIIWYILRGPVLIYTAFRSPGKKKIAIDTKKEHVV